MISGRTGWSVGNTQLKAQGPSRTCHESKEEEEEKKTHQLRCLTRRALACLTIACLPLACSTRACLTLACLPLACSTRACLTLACLTLACLPLACLPLACLQVRGHGPAREREFFIDNLLVRIHFIIEMIGWTGLAPWEF